jgi:proteic killer suppression protein
MIRTARDRRVWELLAGQTPRRFPPDLVRAVQFRLMALDSAPTLDTLRLPPSNRLEALRGGRGGQHSIRINRQWRICFRWVDNNAEDVEIVDYH